MNKNRKYIYGILVFLIVLSLSSIIFIYNKYNTKEMNNKNNVQFAVWVEQTKGEQDYIKYPNNLWPKEGYIFNNNMSKCLDINNNVINNVLSYDKANGIAYLNTSKTVYCYLYFNIE